MTKPREKTREELQAEIEDGKVPSRFMRKIVCRLRLNEVSQQ